MDLFNILCWGCTMLVKNCNVACLKRNRFLRCNTRYELCHYSAENLMSSQTASERLPVLFQSGSTHSALSNGSSMSSFCLLTIIKLTCIIVYTFPLSPVVANDEE